MQKIFNIVVIFVLSMSLYGHNLQQQQISELKKMNTKIVGVVAINARDNNDLQDSLTQVIDAINDGAVYIDYEVTK